MNKIRYFVIISHRNITEEFQPQIHHLYKKRKPQLFSKQLKL